MYTTYLAYRAPRDSVDQAVNSFVIANGLNKKELRYLLLSYTGYGRRGGLMVSALDSGASGPGSSPGRGHCVVFLSKTLYSHSASLHPGV